MNKIILTGAVTAAMLFTLAVAMAAIPPVQDGAVREWCVSVTCRPANSPVTDVLPGQYASFFVFVIAMAVTTGANAQPGEINSHMQLIRVADRATPDNEKGVT